MKFHREIGTGWLSGESGRKRICPFHMIEECREKIERGIRKEKAAVSPAASSMRHFPVREKSVIGSLSYRQISPGNDFAKSYDQACIDPRATDCRSKASFPSDFHRGIRKIGKRKIVRGRGVGKWNKDNSVEYSFLIVSFSSFILFSIYKESNECPFYKVKSSKRFEITI